MMSKISFIRLLTFYCNAEPFNAECCQSSNFMTSIEYRWMNFITNLINAQILLDNQFFGGRIFNETSSMRK